MIFERRPRLLTEVPKFSWDYQNTRRRESEGWNKGWKTKTEGWKTQNDYWIREESWRFNDAPRTRINRKLVPSPGTALREASPGGEMVDFLCKRTELAEVGCSETLLRAMCIDQKHPLLEGKDSSDEVEFEGDFPWAVTEALVLKLAILFALSADFEGRLISQRLGKAPRQEQTRTLNQRQSSGRQDEQPSGQALKEYSAIPLAAVAAEVPFRGGSRLRADEAGDCEWSERELSEWVSDFRFFIRKIRLILLRFKLLSGCSLSTLLLSLILIDRLIQYSQDDLPVTKLNILTLLRTSLIIAYKYLEDLPPLTDVPNLSTAPPFHRRAANQSPHHWSSPHHWRAQPPRRTPSWKCLRRRSPLPAFNERVFGKQLAAASNIGLSAGVNVRLMHSNRQGAFRLKSLIPPFHPTVIESTFGPRKVALQRPSTLTFKKAIIESTTMPRYPPLRTIHKSKEVPPSTLICSDSVDPSIELSFLRSIRFDTYVSRRVFSQYATLLLSFTPPAQFGTTLPCEAFLSRFSSTVQDFRDQIPSGFKWRSSAPPTNEPKLTTLTAFLVNLWLRLCQFFSYLLFQR